MSNLLRDYLTFTKKERNGLLILILLIVSVLGYLYLDLDSEIDNSTDMALFENELAALQQASLDQDNQYQSERYTSKSKSANEISKKPYVYHEFNPNYVTDEEWAEMGLKQWQINGLRSYREKAGDIQSSKQFSKLNVISDEFFEKVRKHLVFEDGKLDPIDRSPKIVEAPLSIALNIASSTHLMQLKGIGPAFSNRIVKYRNWLGGFMSMDQLLEVYGLEDSLYQEIIPFLSLDTNQVSKININTVMIAELRKHPYVKWNVASAIVNYRDQHGPYKTVAEIRKTDLVSSELYRKIAPYFSVDNN